MLLTIPIFLWQCNHLENRKLNIAVAASLQPVMQEVSALFSQQYQIPINLIPGASGVLATQITQGAPYDLFLSADIHYPKFILEQNRGDSISIFAVGHLIIWAKDSRFSPTLSTLSSPLIKTIAIPNPKVAPFGKRAITLLQQAGVYKEVKPKLIYGENISHTTQLIHSGAVDIGITAKSQMYKFKKGLFANWREIPSRNSQLKHGAIALNSAVEDSTKSKFLKFLITPKVKKIFKKYGYTTHLDRSK